MRLGRGAQRCPNDIETRDPAQLGEATDIAAEAIDQRFGALVTDVNLPPIC